MAAWVERKKYPVSEIPFFLVRCNECLVVCNSGHHYRADEQGLAAAEARKHNRTEHPLPGVES